MYVELRVMVRQTWRRLLAARTGYIAIHAYYSQIYLLLHGTHDQLSLFLRDVSKVTQFFHPTMNVIRLDMTSLKTNKLNITQLMLPKRFSNA